MDFTEKLQQELDALQTKGNLRRLPTLEHDGRYVIANGQRMLNLSSNDYLGLATDIDLRREFLETLTPETFLPTSSSSRLLTGNYHIYDELEAELASRFGKEAALVFNAAIMPTQAFASRGRCRYTHIGRQTDTCQPHRRTEAGQGTLSALPP